MNKKSSRRVTLNARSPIRKRLLCSFSKLHKRFNNLVQKFVRKVFLQKNDSFLFRRNIKGGIFGQSCSIFLLKMIFAQLGNVAATLRRCDARRCDVAMLDVNDKYKFEFFSQPTTTTSRRSIFWLSAN